MSKQVGEKRCGCGCGAITQSRFVRGHNKKKYRNDEERFWAKVDRRGDDDCWIYKGAITSTGYGGFHIDGGHRGAHRVAYELVKGPIPEGLHLDHLCRVRACVNPAHLEPVTQRENALRSPRSKASINKAKTHCVNGHPFIPENTDYAVHCGRKSRVCKLCRFNRQKVERTRQDRAEEIVRRLYQDLDAGLATMLAHAATICERAQFEKENALKHFSDRLLSEEAIDAAVAAAAETNAAGEVISDGIDIEKALKAAALQAASIPAANRV